MDKERLISIFSDAGAYLKGHFRLASGLHSDSYIQCALVLQHPHIASELSKLLKQKLEQEFPNFRPKAVIGPATGGIILAYEMARQFGCKGMFMERKDGEFALRRGFNVAPGDEILVCEDVVTTGGSVRDAANVLIDNGLNVVAITSLIDRSGGNAKFPVQFVSLLSLDVPVWEPQDCPMCAENIPFDTPGSKGTGR